MSKCSICETRIQKRWEFCPACGANLNSAGDISSYSIDRTRYLWEKEEGGKFIYSNFKAVRNMGSLRKAQSIRRELGDFTHMDFAQLRATSFLYLNPNYINEYFKIGKLIGYYNTYTPLKMAKMDKVVDMLNKTGVWWTVFQKGNIQNLIKEGWLKNKTGMINSIDIGKKKKTIRYDVNEIACGVNSPTPHHCMGIGLMCGQAEALFGGFWDGKLSKCEHRGDCKCEFEISLRKDENKPEIQPLPKEEYNQLIDNIINSAVDSECTYPRKNLGDSFHIGVVQCLNFLLVSLSPGHSILSKHSGRIIGERVIEKTKIEDSDKALSCLEDLLLYWKAGVLTNKPKGDDFIIQMDESAFASGVSNIGMKLDTFLAGIIEGALNQATDEKWQVEETKCIADGDSHCEFRCKQI